MKDKGNLAYDKAFDFAKNMVKSLQTINKRSKRIRIKQAIIKK